MSGNNTKWVRMVAVAVLVTMVAACSSNKSKDGADGTGADGSALGGDGAMSTGTGSDGGLSPEEMAARTGLQYVFYFDFDQSQLNPETRAALDAQAMVLRNQAGSVRLEGHADERGTPEYNLALAERRAKAIANYLILQGIDRSRIETVSYGEERPAALGQDEDSYARNRRVELRP
ncbi:MAG: peptidoglycan-associated lipoprotein Pal [Gammaproteobacteria bacterium]